ncbi:MAG: DUF1254 domain-containing protein [Halobacteriota archaeon]
MKPLWMLSILVIIIVILSSAGCITPTPQNASTNQTIDGITIPTTTGSPTPAEARQIAAAAYVYGYPLVWVDVYKDHQTVVLAPNATLGVAPINQLARPYQAQLTTASLSAQSLPFATYDWAYAQGWFNLTKEPMVLSVPASNGRYYVMTFYDAWQNVFASLGPRTTGNGSGNFALVGPRWNGTLPANVTKVQAPTSTVWLAMRAQQNGAADSAVAAFLDNATLTPLSAWGTNYTPPATVPVPSNVTLDPLVPASYAQIANMTPEVFYGRMATLMVANPPHSADTPVVDQLARIGITPGTSFDWNSLNATMQNAIAQGYNDGIAQVNAAAANWPGVSVVNGWMMARNAGDYGTNYTLRAGMANASPLYNLPQDALYAQSKTNATGVPYSGANDYVLHFANNSTPPVNAFWSITLYDSQGRPVPNAIDRYEISPHLGNLTYNPDGSLDIYIQHVSPGPDKESNWLPAPSGAFQFVFRLYWPQESALNGSWVPPAVQTVGPATTTTNATVSAS